MKRWGMIVLIGCLFGVPSPVQAQADKLLELLFGREEPTIRPEHLKILQLEMSPDPVQERQRVAFRITISNSSGNTGRVTLAIKDRDETIVEARDIALGPGNSQVDFPGTNYQFSRSDHCFTVEADIERTRSPIDAAKEFCAKYTRAGWSLSDREIARERETGRLYVEELQIYPDPAAPGQGIQFTIRLRNDGRPIRGTVRIQDRDQLVAQVENFSLPRGYTELQFPSSPYVFQRLDTCFTVLVDAERTPYQVDASRQFCARPMSWTLRP